MRSAAGMEVDHLAMNAELMNAIRSVCISLRPTTPSYLPGKLSDNSLMMSTINAA
jgi:hypothetical protein